MFEEHLHQWSTLAFLPRDLQPDCLRPRPILNLSNLRAKRFSFLGVTNGIEIWVSCHRVCVETT